MYRKNKVSLVFQWFIKKQLRGSGGRHGPRRVWAEPTVYCPKGILSSWIVLDHLVSSFCPIPGGAREVFVNKTKNKQAFSCSPRGGRERLSQKNMAEKR